MNKTIADKVNGYGAILRFVTPTMIAIIGWLSVTGIDNIRTDINNLKTHFTNHLEHHQDLEVGYERRLSIIETKLNKGD